MYARESRAFCGEPLRMQPSSLAGMVAVADLTPAQAAELDPSQVSAEVAAAGTAVSHSVILARSLGIPMVIGAGDEVLAVPEGTILLVDGSAGTVVVDPSSAQRAEFEEAAARDSVHAEHLLRLAGQPAITADGVDIEVVANIASVSDAAQAVEHGADGVGRLRTEFLFLDRQEPPSSEEQRQVYTEIASAFGGRRLTIRTLDVGGDKAVPYLRALREDNPFLGQRGLRLSLSFPDLFVAELRAIVHATAQFPVTVLFPMVTTIDELRSASPRTEHDTPGHPGDQGTDQADIGPGHPPPGRAGSSAGFRGQRPGPARRPELTTARRRPT